MPFNIAARGERGDRRKSPTTTSNATLAEARTGASFPSSARIKPPQPCRDAASSDHWRRPTRPPPTFGPVAAPCIRYARLLSPLPAGMRIRLRLAYRYEIRTAAAHGVQPSSAGHASHDRTTRRTWPHRAVPPALPRGHRICRCTGSNLTNVGSRLRRGRSSTPGPHSVPPDTRPNTSLRQSKGPARSSYKPPARLPSRNNQSPAPARPTTRRLRTPKRQRAERAIRAQPRAGGGPRSTISPRPDVEEPSNASCDAHRARPHPSAPSCPRLLAGSRDQSHAITCGHAADNSS